MKHLLVTLAIGLSAIVCGYPVKNLTPEAHIAGDTVTKEQLEGKVLLIEFFGHSCGPCVAAMPGTVAIVEKIQKEDNRLVAIASHLWPRNEARLNNFFSRTGGAKLPTYQEFIVEGLPTPRGVPHAVILSPEGKTLWEGHPTRHDEMEKALRDALKALPKKQPSLKEQYQARQRARAAKHPPRQ